MAQTAAAQLPVPRLNSIFPCGSQTGATVVCTVSGNEIENATGLYFSHPGITANPAGDGKFAVAVDKNVPVGQYDVRAIAPLGVSNFRAFVVGDWPELIEKEPNNEPAQAQRLNLPVVVNGKMDAATDVDSFVFHGVKGQRVLINCWAWRIDSQLDGTLMLYDAHGKELAYSGDYYGRDPFIDYTIPEDGDYTVKVWDFVYGGGSDLFYRLHVGSLPHLDAVVPAAVRPGQKKTVTLYGRNLPGGKPAPNGAAIQGRPLEILTQVLDVPADAEQSVSLHTGEAIRPPQSQLDGMVYRLSSAAGSSNPLFLGFTTDPVLVEHEPNNDRATAQVVPIPCEISGTFGAAGDLDHYAFKLDKNEKVVVDIYGERQSGLVDPFLTAFDPAGARIFSSDDGNRNIGAIRYATNTRDARWDFTAPQASVYTVQVRDLYFQQRGDPRFTYRLSVRHPQPDFRLLAVPVHETQPDATVVGRGGKQWLDVLVFRNDGFDDPIRVSATNLPPGVSCDPVVIGREKTSVPLIFEAKADAPLGHAVIRIVGTSTIEGKNVVRVARGGGLTWPTVNTPGTARMADSIVLAVREAPPFSIAATPVTANVKAGEKLSFTITLTRAADWNEGVQLSGFDLPNNATMALVNVAKERAEAKVELVLPATVKPGPYTFTVHASGQVPREYAKQRDPKKSRGNNVRVVATTNPLTITVDSGDKNATAAVPAAAAPAAVKKK